MVFNPRALLDELKGDDELPFCIPNGAILTSKTFVNAASSEARFDASSSALMFPPCPCHSGLVNPAADDPSPRQQGVCDNVKESNSAMVLFSAAAVQEGPAGPRHGVDPRASASHFIFLYDDEGNDIGMKRVTPKNKKKKAAAWTSKPSFFKASSSAISDEERLDAQNPFAGRIHLDHPSTDEQANAWSHAIVCRLLGALLSLSFVRNAACYRWHLPYKPVIHSIGDRTFLVQLGCLEDKRHIIEDGPWIVAGQVLFVQEWFMSFDPVCNMLHEMSIWVKFPNFPIKMWTRRNLIATAKIIDKPLCFDEATVQHSKVSFARMKVSVNLSRLPAFL